MRTHVGWTLRRRSSLEPQASLTLVVEGIKFHVVADTAEEQAAVST